MDMGPRPNPVAGSDCPGGLGEIGNRTNPASQSGKWKSEIGLRCRRVTRSVLRFPLSTLRCRDSSDFRFPQAPPFRGGIIVFETSEFKDSYGMVCRHEYSAFTPNIPDRRRSRVTFHLHCTGKE